jgi:hypothetical protein
MKTHPFRLALIGVLVFFIFITYRWLEDSVVFDNIGRAPRNFPPVYNRWIYRLVEIDSKPVRRQLPHFIDQLPGAVVAPGSHLFEVAVTPAFHRHDEIPREIEFTANVEAWKKYIIGSQGGRPVLVEERDKPKPH